MVLMEWAQSHVRENYHIKPKWTLAGLIDMCFKYIMFCSEVHINYKGFLGPSNFLKVCFYSLRPRLPVNNFSIVGHVFLG